MSTLAKDLNRISGADSGVVFGFFGKCWIDFVVDSGTDSGLESGVDFGVDSRADSRADYAMASGLDAGRHTTAHTPKQMGMLENCRLCLVRVK